MKSQKRKDLSRLYERYISQNVLSTIMRPQDNNITELTSIASAINAVYGLSLTPADVLNETGWNMDDVRRDKLNNQSVVDGLNIICQNLGLKGFAEEHIYKIPKGNASIQKLWDDFKRGIKDPNCAFIYNDEGYYTNIAGFLEEPYDEDCIGSVTYENRLDWLVFAENSKTWSPIWIRKWGEIRKDIAKKRGGGTIIRLINKSIFKKKSKKTLAKGHSESKSKVESNSTNSNTLKAPISEEQPKNIQLGTNTSTEKKSDRKKFKPEAFIDSYIVAIEKLKMANPTFSDLCEVSGLPAKSWAFRLKDSNFIIHLRNRIKKMQGYRYSKSARSKQFWKNALEGLDVLIDKIVFSKDASSKKTVPHNDNHREIGLYADLDEAMNEEKAR